MQLVQIVALLVPGQLMFGGISSMDTFYWSGKIPAGQILEIKGVNGGIHAESSESDVVEVIAKKDGEISDPADVGVQVVEHNGGVTVCAVYPMASENSCQPGAGISPLSGNDIKVEFLVRVPTGVRFVGRTVNGPVETSRLEGDAEAHTVNGNIRLSTSGSAQAETVNGSIQAALGKVDAPAKFSTVNGGIAIEMKSDTHADLYARTVTGAISSNFPIRVHGRLVNRHAHGRIGRGGPELTIRTVNGSISLRHTCERSL